MKRIFLFLLRLVILAAIIAALVFAGRKLIEHKRRLLAQAPKYGLKPVPVRVAPAKKGRLNVTLAYLAVCEPNRRTALSARITAPIEEISCDEGTVVEAGQVLIRLDDRDMREEIAVLEAETASARAELEANDATIESLEKSVAYWRREAERDRTLADKGTLAETKAEATEEKANEFEGKLAAARRKSEALQHKIEALQRRKGQLKVKLGYAVIRSPYDGIVARRLVDPGDLAAPGRMLLLVEDRSRVKLSFNVPQADLSDIREGLPLVYEVDGRRYEAKLTHLYPSLDNDRTLRAECLLEGGAAAIPALGSYVPVSVIVRRLENAVLVPSSALIESPQGALHVFVVRDGKLAHEAVEVIGRDRDMAAVKGIEAGELVVKNTFLGWANLAGDMEVEPLP